MGVFWASWEYIDNLWIGRSTSTGITLLPTRLGRLPTGGNKWWAQFAAAGAKRRRNKDPIEKRTLELDDEMRKPTLPREASPQGEDWHPRSAAWWETWRRSA